jgi:hypothetical protein
MSQIKKFIDKVANAEGRQAKDLLMPIHDAKQLRDEIMKLLIDIQSANPSTTSIQGPEVEVVMKGAKW